MLLINRLILLGVMITFLRPPVWEALWWFVAGGSGMILADQLVQHRWAGLWIIPMGFWWGWPQAQLGFLVLGGAFSIFTAAMTPRGVAWHPWMAYRMQIFKGGHQPGSLSEFLLVGGLLVLTFSLVHSTASLYMMNWWALYEAGIIDLAEWRLHRFHWF